MQLYCLAFSCINEKTNATDLIFALYLIFLFFRSLKALYLLFKNITKICLDGYIFLPILLASQKMRVSNLVQCQTPPHTANAKLFLYFPPPGPHTWVVLFLNHQSTCSCSLSPAYPDPATFDLGLRVEGCL